MENSLFELTARRRSVRRYTDKHIDEATIDEIMKVALTAPSSFGHDPVEFVVIQDKKEDGAIASAYILLAAEQYDIGACWVHIRNRKGKRKSSDEEIRELLGVPQGYAVLNLVALGGKGEVKQGYTEADLDKRKVHFEKF